NQLPRAAALDWKVKKFISLWAPQLRRSTSPGLGVAAASKSSPSRARDPMISAAFSAMSFLLRVRSVSLPAVKVSLHHPVDSVLHIRHGVAAGAGADLGLSNAEQAGAVAGAAELL